MSQASRVARLQARVKERILASTETLTVHYPAARATVSGTAPVTTTPVSPLLAPEATPVWLAPTEAEPVKPSVTMSCLWLDSYQGLVSGLGDDRVRVSRMAWRTEAHAVARVLVEDAALDPLDPQGDTVFSGADYVEYRGHRYQVLAVDPIGASMAAPASYYVWLQGAARQ